MLDTRLCAQGEERRKSSANVEDFKRVRWLNYCEKDKISVSHTIIEFDTEILKYLEPMLLVSDVQRVSLKFC